MKFSHDYSIANCILEVYNKTEEKFVILLDEYDILIRENIERTHFMKYLDFLMVFLKAIHCVLPLHSRISQVFYLLSAIKFNLNLITLMNILF